MGLMEIAVKSDIITAILSFQKKKNKQHITAFHTASC